MNIEILKLLKGAKQASGLTVVIDVFRAFSTACYIINQNGKLFVTDSIDVAENFKYRNSSTVTAGERKGIKIEGFDFGNSPFEVNNTKFSNNPVVLTTSAGTKGIINARNASKIITGSFVNAESIVSFIKSRGFKKVSLVAMGNNGVEINKEDMMCARYIKNRVLDKKTNIDPKNLEDLLKDAGKRFFDKNNKESYPQDYYLSLKINKFDFVLEAIKIKDSLYRLKKIE